ncbi:MAG: type III-A CRISPR-associated protein Cas10/Csm1, partial [Pseudanabaena sp. M57BS1SP1A06MG]|nr:type III-A CRISPR-associated protein Cas10/Csm1 [Pseudanabaena sp. M57BS1SP1A06MG]
MANSNNFNQIALEVFQVAIADLLGENLLDICKLNSEENAIIQKARYLLGLNREVNTLSLLFDRVKLPDGEGANQDHYVPLPEIVSNAEGYPKIPYPIAEQPKDLQKYRTDIAKEINPYLSSDRWNDLSFLTFILEKYGSCVSYGEPYTALIDAARMTAAVAVALSQNQESGAEEKFHLVAGSLSGIQKFIYTISSDGALKSLRARSFYLELVAEEIVQQILDELKLPRTNVIYAGGGNLFILASDSNNSLKSKLENLRNRFNKWLEERFKGKIFLSLACSSCNRNDVKSSSFGNCWKNVISELAKQKSQKFSHQIKNGKLLDIKPSYQPCKVCHRDDVKAERLKSLHEVSDVLACPTCRKMFRLGGQLFRTKAILRSQRPKIPSALDRVEILGQKYYLFERLPELQEIECNDKLILVNDFDVNHYHYSNCNLLLLGNYSQQGEEGFMRAEEMTEKAKDSGCIPRVGYLRMDVDRLGQIFAKGLPNKEDSPHNIDEYSLPRVASLSRQMSYFFKVYLNSLAGDRANNLPEKVETLTTKSDKNFSRCNLMFIYAGGDDLFISGAWNEVVEFAFDIYQSFRAYTGNHP